MPMEPPQWTKFALAGLGGFSGWCFVHPFDVIKVRVVEFAWITFRDSGKNILHSR